MSDESSERDQDTALSTIEYLTFFLNKEVYGLDLLQVQEIRSWEKATPLPSMPNYVKGVINIRGAVVPVMDLRERFQIGEPSHDELTVIIVCAVRLDNGEEKMVGLVVDGVSDVERIDPSALQPAPSFDAGQKVDETFIGGLASVEREDTSFMVTVLNAQRLVSVGLLDALKQWAKDSD